MSRDEPPPIDASPDQWAIVRDILRRHVPEREVWAFGSRAARTAKPYSDLDLAVIGEAPLSLDTLAAMREAFSESDLPWKVDVLDWATTDAEFRKMIKAGKVVAQSRGVAGSTRMRRGFVSRRAWRRS